MLMQCRRSLLALLGSCAVLAAAPAAMAVSIEAIATPFTGDPSAVKIVLTESGGDIVVTVSVIQNHGDLRAVFLNIADDSLLEGLSATGVFVTDFETGGVKNLGQGANITGDGSPCPCDIGVELGTPGSGIDDIHETSFTLHHETLDLMLDQFTSQVAGVRVTSVGPEECFDGSSKLATVFPTEVPEPTSALLIAFGLGLIGAARRARS